LEPQRIPIHDFSKDDTSSIPFSITPLALKTHYDSSVPHRHNYYEIFIFNKAGGTHEIDFNFHDIAENSVHFVSPGQVHHVERGIGTYGYVILFSREFIALNANDAAKLFELPFLNNAPNPVLDMDERAFSSILPLVESMKVEASESGEVQHASDIIRSTLMILLMKCHRLYCDQNPEDETIYKSHTYRQFRILLEQHFARNHKVKDYAELLSTSEKTLNESIKKVTGKTVSDLIYARIVLEAKRLLLHSGMSAKEIAYALNFGDPAHFSKFFKKQTGLSPSEYKNSLR
jgi:AraC-like DNA-binding protein